MNADQSIRFEYRVGWSPDYGQLFRGNFSDVTPIDEILERGRRHGRILLLGKGGSGKSTIAIRLSEKVAATGGMGALLNLKHWHPGLQAKWDELSDDLLGRADLMLSELAEMPISLVELDEQPPSTPKYIIFDGLNEIRSAIAEQVIAAADRLAGAIINITVIATDRLIRRDLSAHGEWLFANVLRRATHSRRSGKNLSEGDCSSHPQHSFQLLWIGLRKPHHERMSHSDTDVDLP
jgi:hypothetical protein